MLATQSGASSLARLSPKYHRLRGSCYTQSIRLGGRALWASCQSQSLHAAGVDGATGTQPLRPLPGRPGQRPVEPLPKSFEPRMREASIYSWWESNALFGPRPASLAPPDAPPPFVMTMPPPNITGKLHMGHAMFVTLQDILARFHRLRGRDVLWLPGTDHAGIATQMTVQRALRAEGKNREMLGRAGFEQRVWEWKDKCGGEITAQLRRLGASCDWGRERFTLDPGSCDAVVTAFSMLHERGLIYRGSYMVNWSPGLRTAVSDLEVEYTEEPGLLYYFRYPIEGSEGEYLPIATTRPETILGDTALAVHPEDSRFRHLVGRKAVVPLVGRRIPIIADSYVDPEFGTGALKITPGHDINDYELGRRHNLEIINIMNDDGTLNEAAGTFVGLPRDWARQSVWQGLEALDDGSLRFIPERFEKVYRHWLTNIKDWCISRQLWWGHRLPVWYVYDSHDAAERDPKRTTTRYVIAEDIKTASTLAKAAHGPHAVVRQETDVLDTWFSSGLWPFSTLGWPNTEAEDYRRFYPTTVLETGHDILFFWVARMAMLGLELTDTVPFHTVYLHGLVRDDKGRKMSKTLGNVVDPVKLCNKYAADALRFTLSTGTSPGLDVNLSLDRVTAARHFTHKLWNAAKFVLFNLESLNDAEWERLADVDYASPAAREGLPLAERWALAELDRTIDGMTLALERYDFGEAGRALYDFVWSDFADWYIEASKTRLYGGDERLARQARQVLVYIFTSILTLAHPIAPFITEEIWAAMPAARLAPALIRANWPRTPLSMGISGGAADAYDSVATAQFGSLQALVRAVRNSRAEYNVELGRRIAAHVVGDDEVLVAALRAESAVISSLARLDPNQLTFARRGAAAGQGAQDAASAVRLVVAEGLEVELPMTGLFDVHKELARLRKQEERLAKEAGNLQGRLDRPGFRERAPQHVVEDVKRNLGEIESQLTTVRGQLTALQPGD